ncbi:MAG: YraN family protein [Candidatus Nomurabacteria bacterium]|nr:MAG: YraN family protein [Candidatus Nomurabacteria bacterium]
MPKVFTSKSQVKGKMGENIAKKYFINKGFSEIEDNFMTKRGEIDLIMKESVSHETSKIHFIEVKSSFCDLSMGFTGNNFRPEENMTPKKVGSLKVTIEEYIVRNNIEGEWVFDLALVYIDKDNKLAKVDVLENIIL